MENEPKMEGFYLGKFAVIDGGYGIFYGGSIGANSSITQLRDFAKAEGLHPDASGKTRVPFKITKIPDQYINTHTEQGTEIKYPRTHSILVGERSGAAVPLEHDIKIDDDITI